MFPGKTQSDLLTSPEYTAASDELVRSMRECESGEGEMPESREEGRRMSELEDLFTKLGLVDTNMADRDRGSDHTHSNDPPDHQILGPQDDPR